MQINVVNLCITKQNKCMLIHENLVAGIDVSAVFLKFGTLNQKNLYLWIIMYRRVMMALR